jgi:anti-anti-sigma regulatory factor
MDAEHAGARALVLDGPITATTVPALRQHMLAVLAAGPACVIHGRGVTQLDAAGAQLLYAFITEAARRGGRCAWVSASVFLVEAARMLGMERCIGLDGLSAAATSWRP